MDKKYDELWEKFLKNLKIAKIKAIKFWHRFDKEFGVSRFAKKMILALGLKLVTLSMPNAQISLHAQNVQKKQPSELLANANTFKKNESYINFMEQNQDKIIERQKEFAITLWNTMQKNIKDVQEAEQRGKTARTKKLIQMFNKYKEYGLTVHPNYFCSTGGLGSFIQSVDKSGLEEYRLLIECLTNPNSCSSIIRDFEKYFGPQKETNDIPKTLSEIYKKNPYAVCIVFPHSKRSTSGYHYTTTFSNTVAVDTVLTAEDSINGKAARFNRTAIADIDKYYINERKKGYVFDITEMIGNYQVFQMYMDYLQKMNEIPNNRPGNHFSQINTDILNNESVASLIAWEAVGNEKKPSNTSKKTKQPKAITTISRQQIMKKGGRLS